MRNLWVIGNCAAAAALLASGCPSSPPEYTPSDGELPAGTAQISINGQDAGTTGAVQCNTTEWLTTISTGDQTAGINALVSNRDDLAVETVSINNLGGFTGTYTADVGPTGGEAEIAMAGRTYQISGTADGFSTDEPSFRVPATFTIKVAC